jgi:P4 family phage/plasmid primase-like protien
VEKLIIETPLTKESMREINSFFLSLPPEEKWEKYQQLEFKRKEGWENIKVNQDDQAFLDKLKFHCEGYKKLVEVETEDFIITKYKDNGEVKSKKVDIEKVSNYLLQKHNFKTWFGKKSDYCFNFDGKIYSTKSRGLVKVECEELLNSYCRKNLVEEIYDKIKRKSKIEREEFEKLDTNYIPLENGIWDIENKKLIPHSKDFNFTFLIPQEFHEDAKCPNWFKFIDESLYPEDIPVMQEWFGFLLYREYFIKKGIICVGEQNTGKSVLLDTAIKFIGDLNKCGLSLQKITSGSDFTKLSLKGKHANVYDDLSSNDLSDGGAFKVATGGGYISGEEKFGEYQEFRSFAKQMFATNKIPPVKDNDDLAYFGRWIVFKFDNVPEKLDPFLRKKLWSKEEMSGILNWALEGLYRLLENGKFSYRKDSEEIKLVMEMSGNPLAQFSGEVLQKEDGNVITKDEMFKYYSLWCSETNRPRLSKEMLGRRLESACSYILATKDKARIWKNAKISDSWKKKLENIQNMSISDTSDTFQKNMRNISKSSKNDKNRIVDIIFEKASEVSEVYKK